MNITRAAIENNRVTIVALLVILAAGIGAYGNMSRSEDPGFVIRTAQVLTIFPGASPERVEMLVTDKLEKVIQEMPEIDFINSESKDGVSVVLVNIKERYKSMRPIWDDLRRKVDRASGDLPDGVIGPTVNDEFGDVFGTVYTLTGEGFTYAELKQIADQVRDELLLIGEVAKVDIYGAQEERIFVEYNNSRLSELGLSPVQLGQILDSRNIVLPGGDVTVGEERIVLEPSGNFETVDELRRTILNLPGRNEFVYLQDIASISRGYIDPPDSKVKVSGTQALALAVSMRDGGNIINLGKDVRATMARMQAAYPIGIEFEAVAFQPDEVSRSVNDFVTNLLQAIGVVVVVMLLFLGLRTGLVVASLIPMAILMALLIMSTLDIGLNMVSLAALIIALGLLVDNAIVMVESIMVQMSEGKAAVNAAIDSAAELRVPLLVSSLTTAAAFLPIFLAESSTGEYVAPLFKVVTITLLCSWILALTMIPALAVIFVKAKSNAKEERYDSAFYRRYRGALIFALKHRTLTVAGTLVIFFLTMSAFRLLPQIFFPPTDKSFFKAEFELPLGTSIQRTEEVVAGIEKFMAEELLAGSERPSGVTSWATFIGQGGPRYRLNYNPEPPSPNYAALLVNTTAWEFIDEYIARIDSFAFVNYPDLASTMARFENGPPIEAPVQVRILGPSTHSRPRSGCPLLDIGPVEGTAANHSGRQECRRRLGAPLEEASGQNKPTARAAGRRHEPGRSHLITGRAQRFRDERVQGGRRADPYHPALDSRGPAGHRKTRKPQRLRPSDRRIGAAQAGGRHKGRLGAGEDPAPRSAQDRNRERVAGSRPYGLRDHRPNHSLGRRREQ
jgi:multidrug efflux pump subunit AcrB